MPSLHWVMPLGQSTLHVLASHVGVPRLQPMPPSQPPSNGMPASGLFVPGAMPPASATPHAVVHCPQCCGSLESVAQICPASVLHFVVGLSHVDWHFELEQTRPASQALLHEPQCWGSFVVSYGHVEASVVASTPPSGVVVSITAFAQAASTHRAAAAA